MSVPLSVVATAPWWMGATTFLGIAGLILGYVRPGAKWIWRRLIAANETDEKRKQRLDELSMSLLDRGQEDARDLRDENRALRKEIENERNSGVGWYNLARFWESKAHEVRHDAVNLQFIVQALKPDALLEKIPPLPALEDLSISDLKHPSVHGDRL